MVSVNLLGMHVLTDCVYIHVFFFKLANIRQLCGIAISIGTDLSYRMSSARFKYVVSFPYYDMVYMLEEHQRSLGTNDLKYITSQYSVRRSGTVHLSSSRGPC